jgi:hypothetical protein
VTDETKRAESHHDDELQWFTHRNSSGSFAMFTAIRRASSFMGGIGPVSNPLSLLLRFPILHFAADSDRFELANDFSSLSQSITFV